MTLATVILGRGRNSDISSNMMAVLNTAIAAKIADGNWLGLKQVNLKAENSFEEDLRLVRLTLSGNSKAFEGLVRKYQKLVYNVLYQMLGSHECAGDITQETFLKAYKALPTFKQSHSFKPWLLRIATNTALNNIRDNKGSDSLDALLDDNPSIEPAYHQNVESEVIFRVSHQHLMDALKDLPIRHRHIFLLRYSYDLSYDEICTIVDEPETTIKPLLFRIREKLRKLLKEKIQLD